MKDKRYWQISQNGREAELTIYGDIRSWKWEESDVSAYDIKKEIDAIDADTINVRINSYGGEVAEALAIYSCLKRNSATVHTFCDGFACSAASIIFCAGDVRTMGELSLLMIHNCMSYIGYANSDELRKAAEDNDKINQSSIEAYKHVSNLSEDEIKDLMDAETWLTADEAVQYGFATDKVEDEEEEGYQQSAFSIVRDAVLRKPEEHKDDLAEKLDRIIEMLEGKALKEEQQEEPGQKQPEQIEQGTTRHQKAISFFDKLFM